MRNFPAAGPCIWLGLSNGFGTCHRRFLHVYEVRPRKDKRGVDLISDALPFGRMWYAQSNDAVEYAKFLTEVIVFAGYQLEFEPALLVV